MRASFTPFNKQLKMADLEGFAIGICMQRGRDFCVFLAAIPAKPFHLWKELWKACM
jgi:hypothetical protein